MNLHQKDHVGYHPGAQTPHLKLLFSKRDDRTLGMQAVGTTDVVTKISVVSA